MLHTRTTTGVEREGAEEGGSESVPAMVTVAGLDLKRVSQRSGYAMWSTDVGVYPIVIATRMKSRALQWSLTAFVREWHGGTREVKVFAPALIKTESLLCDELYRLELGAWAVQLGIDHHREAA